MNNSEKRAEALAQVAELVRKANESGHNLEGIARLLQYSHPQDIADSLLEIYFEITFLMTCSKDYDYEYIGGALVDLREVYKAFAKASKPSEAPIVFTVGDLSNNA